METLLLVLLVAAAASICPAMMWWQRRRGRDPACHVPMGRRASAVAGDDADLEALRDRRDVLAARIAELEDRPDHEGRPATPSAG